MLNLIKVSYTNFGSLEGAYCKCNTRCAKCKGEGVGGINPTPKQESKMYSSHKYIIVIFPRAGGMSCGFGGKGPVYRTKLCS